MYDVRDDGKMAALVAAFTALARIEAPHRRTEMRDLITTVITAVIAYRLPDTDDAEMIEREVGRMMALWGHVNLTLQELGHDRDAAAIVAEARPLAKNGGDRRSDDAKVDQIDDVKLKNQGGNSAAYLAARLKRDAPEIAPSAAAPGG